MRHEFYHLVQKLHLTLFDYNDYRHALWVSLFAVVLLMAYALRMIYINQRLKQVEKNEYIEQSKAIRLERQRISSELHDELGSGLSAIKLYSELASKKREEIHEFRELNEMIKDISTKINDIIWTTSTENDQLDSVIFFIQEQLSKLFRYSDIKFNSKLPEDIPHLKTKSESRRDLYLLAKEIAHNALKHSKADTIFLDISIFKENITMVIKDDGEGFDPLRLRDVGMGLTNINTRVKRLNGTLTIENYKGTKISVSIPIRNNFYKEIGNGEINNSKKWWRMN
ncbi:sensor histidine kinase [Pedobacter agri]|uniref:sensor histidine kinase n=1 Tax=Pedobacter agri TaxID=454586 RepID=UPI0029305945|nr:ATP-binding protein [Pedobacter agri]